MSKIYSDLENLDRKERLHLINSITGIKPANLIATLDEDSGENLAVFSSIIHLGSNPALIGFVVRPTGEVPRHTYRNILKNKMYTINSIGTSFTEKAHYTSTKFEDDINEFERCNIKAFKADNFGVPFVADSAIKLGMRFVQEIPIELNGTILIIGKIEYIELQEDIQDEFGAVDLEKAELAGIGGLNAYYSLQKTAYHPYARLSEVPDFKK